MKKTYRSQFNARQYMMSEDFEIFFYSDTNFQSVSPHTHDYYEFYIFVDGDVSMEIEKKQYPLSGGDIVVVPSGIRHRAVVHSPQKPYRRFVFWISQKYYDRLKAESSDYIRLIHRAVNDRKYISHLPDSDYHTLQAKLIRLLEEVNTNRFGREAMLKLAVDELILSLNRRVYELEQTKRSSEKNLLSNVITYINVHLKEDLSLNSIASEFYISKYYLSHLFHDLIGIPLHQYITKKRLESIAELLIAGENATDVCTQYGFKDYSVFYRAFRKEYGISPKEYRTIHNIELQEKKDIS